MGKWMCRDPYILDLSISWRWVDSLVPWPLDPWGKSPWYPLERKLGAPQNQSSIYTNNKI
jgi:hypothetical protein